MSDPPPYKCGLCNDYAGTEGQVRGHIQGKADERHKGIGYADAKEHIEPNTGQAEASGGRGKGDPEPEAKGQKKGVEPSEPTIPEAEDQSPTDDGDDESCPVCSSELADVRNVSGRMAELPSGERVRMEYADTELICTNQGCDSDREFTYG